MFFPPSVALWVNLCHAKSFRWISRCWGPYRNLEAPVTAVTVCSTSPGLNLHLAVISHPFLQQILRNRQLRQGEELDLVSAEQVAMPLLLCAAGCSPATMKLQLGRTVDQKQMVYEGFAGLRQAIASQWLCRNWFWAWSQVVVDHLSSFSWL